MAIRAETVVVIAAETVAVAASDVAVDAVAAPADDLQAPEAQPEGRNLPPSKYASPQGDQQRPADSRGGYDQRGQQPRGFDPAGTATSRL